MLDKQEANAKIAALVAEAKAKIAEAETIAVESDVSFTWSFRDRSSTFFPTREAIGDYYDWSPSEVEEYVESYTLRRIPTWISSSEFC